MLVGNNEDYINPRTKIWFVPSARGAYGRVYVGFDDLWPQGGMNERGLWFDGFSAPPVRVPTELPTFQGNLIDAVMAECETVEEVVRVFGRYNAGSGSSSRSARSQGRRPRLARPPSAPPVSR